MATDYDLQRLRRLIILIFPEAEIVATCPILWAGWELDNRAVLVRIGDQLRCATTDHGRLVWIKAAFLRSRLEEYRSCIEQTTALLEAWEPSPVSPPASETR